MNSLSLLIYAVGLISNIGTVSVVFTVIGVIGFIFFSILRLIAYGDPPPNEESAKHFTAFARFWHRLATTILCVAIFAQVVVPSRQTTIMIAASEVAEVVIKSEEAQTVMKDVTGLGQDAVGLLKSYIQTEQKKLLDELKPKEEPKKENI